MTNIPLKFVARVFSNLCKNSEYCVRSEYEAGYGEGYCMLRDGVYDGKITHCPCDEIYNSEKSIDECGLHDISPKAWYRILCDINVHHTYEEFVQWHKEFCKLLKEEEQEEQEGQEEDEKK